jgi:hypothetical protein
LLSPQGGRSSGGRILMLAPLASRISLMIAPALAKRAPQMHG